MSPFVIIAGILALVAAGVFIVVRSRGSSQTVEDRLNELAAMGQSVTLEELELSQPFSQRVLVPMGEALAKVAQRFTPGATIESTRHKLQLAGIAHKVRAAQFVGYRVAGALLLGLSSLLVVFASSIPFFQRLLIIFVAFLMGYLLPGTWLGSKISQAPG